MRYFINEFASYESIYGPSNSDERPHFRINETDIKKILDIYLHEFSLLCNNHNGFGGYKLYVGDAGKAFMYLKLSLSQNTTQKLPSLQKAKSLIENSKGLLEKTTKKPEDAASFLSGNAGVYAVSSVINHYLGNFEECQKDLEKFLKGYEVAQKRDSNEIFHGRAGYLCGIYWLNQHLPASQRISGNIISKICDAIIESGIQYSRNHSLDVPLMWEWHGKMYFGAAHGISAILHMLLESPLFAGNLEKMNEKQKLVKASIDGLLQMQAQDGNFPSSMGHVRETDHKLVHWCHGAPGAIYLIAKAYLIFKEQNYLKSCLKCGELVWNKGLLRKGPGICHGVSGNGYVFLLLYRLTNDLKHLYRASCFAKFLINADFKEHARTPDNPYSLYEGYAGAICFLIDMLDPDKATFPFMDVFDLKC